MNRLGRSGEGRLLWVLDDLRHSPSPRIREAAESAIAALQLDQTSQPDPTSRPSSE